MATKIQTELFSKNKQCTELATLMVNNVYPKLVNLMHKLCMSEVRFSKIEGFRNYCLTIDYKLQFFSTTDGDKKKTDQMYVLDCSGKNLCPLFDRTEHDSVEAHESATDRYLRFCKNVISAIEPLEKKLSSIDEVLEMARNVNVPLNRNVIFEKHSYAKKDKA